MILYFSIKKYFLGSRKNFQFFFQICTFHCGKRCFPYNILLKYLILTKKSYKNQKLRTYNFFLNFIFLPKVAAWKGCFLTKKVRCISTNFSLSDDLSLLFFRRTFTFCERKSTVYLRG